MNTLKVFETILKDKEKMKHYKSDPLRHAAFMAMYEYSQKGLKFCDLPWFSLSVKTQEKAA